MYRAYSPHGADQRRGVSRSPRRDRYEDWYDHRQDTWNDSRNRFRSSRRRPNIYDRRSRSPGRGRHESRYRSNPSRMSPREQPRFFEEPALYVSNVPTHWGSDDLNRVIDMAGVSNIFKKPGAGFAFIHVFDRSHAERALHEYQHRHTSLQFDWARGGRSRAVGAGFRLTVPHLTPARIGAKACLDLVEIELKTHKNHSPTDSLLWDVVLEALPLKYRAYLEGIPPSFSAVHDRKCKLEQVIKSDAKWPINPLLGNTDTEDTIDMRFLPVGDEYTAAKLVDRKIVRKTVSAAVLSDGSATGKTKCLVELNKIERLVYLSFPEMHAVSIRKEASAVLRQCKDHPGLICVAIVAHVCALLAFLNMIARKWDVLVSELPADVVMAAQFQNQENRFSDLFEASFEVLQNQASQITAVTVREALDLFAHTVQPELENGRRLVCLDECQNVAEKLYQVGHERRSFFQLVLAVLFEAKAFPIAAGTTSHHLIDLQLGSANFKHESEIGSVKVFSAETMGFCSAQHCANVLRSFFRLTDVQYEQWARLVCGRYRDLFGSIHFAIEKFGNADCDQVLKRIRTYLDNMWRAIIERVQQTHMVTWYPRADSAAPIAISVKDLLTKVVLACFFANDEPLRSSDSWTFPCLLSDLQFSLFNAMVARLVRMPGAGKAFHMQHYAICNDSAFRALCMFHKGCSPLASVMEQFNHGASSTQVKGRVLDHIHALSIRKFKSLWGIPFFRANKAKFPKALQPFDMKFAQNERYLFDRPVSEILEVHNSYGIPEDIALHDGLMQCRCVAPTSLIVSTANKYTNHSNGHVDAKTSEENAYQCNRANLYTQDGIVPQGHCHRERMEYMVTDHTPAHHLHVRVELPMHGADLYAALGKKPPPGQADDVDFAIIDGEMWCVINMYNGKDYFHEDVWEMLQLHFEPRQIRVNEATKIEHLLCPGIGTTIAKRILECLASAFFTDFADLQKRARVPAATETYFVIEEPKFALPPLQLSGVALREAGLQAFSNCR